MQEYGFSLTCILKYFMQRNSKIQSQMFQAIAGKSFTVYCTQNRIQSPVKNFEKVTS